MRLWGVARYRAAALATAALAALAAPAGAQDGAWRADAPSGDFNAGSNWVLGSPPAPGGVAVLGPSAQTNLTTSADASISGFLLSAGASNYTFTNDHVLQITGVGILVQGGGLTLTNNASLTFSGTSSAGAATIINNCCLVFSDRSTAGSATITNTFSGSIAFDGTSSAGAARITNDGLVIFGNPIDPTATASAGQATIINTGGVLFIGASNAGTATIINNGSVAFAHTSTAGAASITNNATLTFTGSSTAGTATIINNCCLTFQDNSSAAHATIMINGGGVTYLMDDASGGTARFVVHAGGSLDVADLTNGGTTVGSIEGAGDILLGSNQLRIGGLNTSTLFSGTIADGPFGVGGSLVKEGTGTLTLIGANTYTGRTTVNGGTLAINGSVTSDVTVNAGGTLMGTGEMQALAIMSGGWHAPGNSIGTQTVNGGYSNTGTLQVEVNGAGQSDRVVVNGGVDITGATLQLVAQVGAYQPSQQYLIIQNDGGAPVVGTFGAINSALAFLTPTISTTGGDGDDVVLSLTRNAVSFTDVALTPNQKAVASALQSGFNSGTGSDGANVIGALLGLTAPEARRAYDLMAGDTHASLVHILFGQASQLSNLAGERLSQVGGSWATVGVAQPSGLMGLGMAPGQRHETQLANLEDTGNAPWPGRHAWVRIFGDGARIDDDRNAGAMKSRGGGIVAGADMSLAPGIVIGAMAGWTNADIELASRATKAEVDGGHVALYGRVLLGDLMLKGVASYSHHGIDATRHIEFGGLVRTAQADYSADQATLYGEVARRWSFGRVDVMPTAAVRWSYLDVGAFSETGAGALNLTSSGDSYETLDTIAGVRLGTTVRAHGSTWMPQARILWTHSFGDVDPRLGLNLEGGGTFLVRGVDRDRDVLTLGAGLNVSLGQSVLGFIDYDAHLSENARTQALSAGLRVRF